MVLNEPLTKRLWVDLSWIFPSLILNVGIFSVCYCVSFCQNANPNSRVLGALKERGWDQKNREIKKRLKISHFWKLESRDGGGEFFFEIAKFEATAFWTHLFSRTRDFFSKISNSSSKSKKGCKQARKRFLCFWTWDLDRRVRSRDTINCFSKQLPILFVQIFTWP